MCQVGVFRCGLINNQSLHMVRRKLIIRPTYVHYDDITLGYETYLV